MIIKKNVKSSAINSAEYNTITHTLTIEFKQERKYDYYDVPEYHFHQLINADSVGKYFNKYIKQYSIR